MTNELIKGFRDYTEEEARKRAEIKKIIVDVFEKYGFEPTETPVIESEEFVKGENPNDEAVSDIYRLQDKGKRKLALRYEFTFQLKRLMKNKKLPWKRYQIGEVFRDEPVQGNRLRQFTQCDADVVGSTIKDEAEILAMTKEILLNLKIKPVILIGNRKLLNEILEEQCIEKKYWEQVLREIDKYDKLPETQVIKNLKKFGADKILKCLKQGEKYFSKFESYKEVFELMKYCDYYGVKILFSPTIVRGFSYYNGNVFEIKSGEIKETIVAGGSYEFNDVRCTGISFGLDRLASLAKIKTGKEKYLIVSLGQDKKATKLTQKLRRQNKSASIYYGKPSKALQYANSYNINKVIFVGENEVKSKKFKVKDMTSGYTKPLRRPLF